MCTVTYSNFNENSKRYLDDILRNNEEIVILKNKKPTLKISSLTSKIQENLLKNSIIDEGDLISPIDEKWSCD
jgi:hypothetical protein